LTSVSPIVSAKQGGFTDAADITGCASGAALNHETIARPRAVVVEVLGYGLVSAIALAIDAAILRTLVVIWGWHYLPASVVAFISGAAVAYVLSVRFVFRSRQVNNRVLEFGYFLLLGVVGLLVNAAALSLAITGIGLGLLKAKACAAACTFTTNFILRRALLFTPKRSS
jgi:putative flippase GtrA